MSQPLFSILMCVKNGMPYLPEALKSLAAQSCRDFELIIQDGASTDGTLEVLARAKNIPNMRIASAPDRGQGEAYGRALERCTGQLVATLDSDNLLAPDALESMAALFAEHPEAAAIYAGANLIDSQGHVTAVFMPAAFDLLRMLRSELVPPFSASFFSRNVCGDALRFDAQLRMCQDFDLWLRLSHLPILRAPRVVASMRHSGTNVTSRPENYDQLSQEKIAALEAHLLRGERDPLWMAVSRQLCAGVYCWAAECVFELEGASARVPRYLRLATELDPAYERIRTLQARLPEAPRFQGPPRVEALGRSVAAGLVPGAANVPGCDVDSPLQAAGPPSPATAYWNQRCAVVHSSGRLRALRQALDDTSNLSSFQWAQWFAYAREYRPDLVIELGRRKGSATAVFAEALSQNQHGTLVSLCENKTWKNSLKLLRPLVGADWLGRLEIRTGQVARADFHQIVGDARRVLIVWQEAGFAAAEAVLGRLMPILQDRKHVILMHDISDRRYCGSELAYGEGRLWQGSDWASRHGRYDCRVYLGWISTVVEQAIAVVDFLTRNRSELQSADHSFHLEIGADAARRKQMKAVLSPEDFSLAGHWAYFSLNGAPQPYTFPKVGG
jgi:hypothetical protein